MASATAISWPLRIAAMNRSSVDRELNELIDVAVISRPPHRRPDAQLDAAHRIVLVGDRLLLGHPQGVLRVAEDLDEELFLAVEVPVEDALAHAEALDDLGHRGRVVAVLGEARRRVVHELLATLLASLSQPPGHRAPR